MSDLAAFAWMLWLTIAGFGVLKIIRQWVETALKVYAARTTAMRGDQS